MEIIPAIDIIQGKVVRLQMGEFEKKTTYSEEPINVARKWKELGAKIIHVVDLDGARTGKPRNLSIVKEIAGEVDVQFGGGLRREKDVEEVLQAGIKFAVVGTKAATDENFSREIISKFGERIIFSVDEKANIVALAGWRKASGVHTLEYVKKLAQLKAKKIIYTDISRDGMMTGPNLESLRIILKSTDIAVIASGGVSSIDDVKALKELEGGRIAGVIIGKALYEGKIDLKEAIECCQKE